MRRCVREYLIRMDCVRACRLSGEALIRVRSLGSLLSKFVCAFVRLLRWWREEFLESGIWGAGLVGRALLTAGL